MTIMIGISRLFLFEVPGGVVAGECSLVHLRIIAVKLKGRLALFYELMIR